MYAWLAFRVRATESMRVRAARVASRSDPVMNPGTERLTGVSATNIAPAPAHSATPIASVAISRTLLMRRLATFCSLEVSSIMKRYRLSLNFAIICVCGHWPAYGWWVCIPFHTAKLTNISQPAKPYTSFIIYT